MDVYFWNWLVKSSVKALDCQEFLLLSRYQSMVYFPYYDQPFERLKHFEAYLSVCWIFEHWVDKKKL